LCLHGTQRQLDCDDTKATAGKRTEYNFFGAEFPESRDRSFKLTPHPAYGSEFSTGGVQFVRAQRAMEPNATRFPFPLPSRTIGEQKAKVKSIFHG